MAKYKLAVVRPAVRKLEEEWFEMQLTRLGNGHGYDYRCIAPMRQPWRQSLHWAPWGRTMWTYFRWWCTARITFAFPLPGFRGGPLPKTLARCPLCQSIGADLEHVLFRCQGTLELRRNMVGIIDTSNVCSALQGCAELEQLYHRVRYVGICLSLVKASHND